MTAAQCSQALLWHKKVLEVNILHFFFLVASCSFLNIHNKPRIYCWTSREDFNHRILCLSQNILNMIFLVEICLNFCCCQWCGMLSLQALLFQYMCWYVQVSSPVTIWFIIFLFPVMSLQYQSSYEILKQYISRNSREIVIWQTITFFLLTILTHHQTKPWLLKIIVHFELHWAYSPILH